MSANIEVSRDVAGRFPAISKTVIETARVCLDPKRIAWAFLDDKGAGTLHVDGRSLHIPGGLELGSPVFSDNGARLGYILDLPRQRLLVVDGVEKKLDADWVENLAFSPDGSVVAYMSWDKRRSLFGKKKDTLWVSVGEERYGPYDSFSHETEERIVFSKTGNHYGFFAWRGKRGRGALAVVDGEELGPYDGVSGSTPTFSDDGSRYAFDAQIGDRWVVVDTGQEGEQFDGTIQHSLSVSANGEHVAYGCGRGSERYLVVDRDTVETYRDQAAVPRLSPDGAHLAKIIVGPRTQIVAIGDRIINRHDHPEPVNIPTFTWSPDSRTVAYLCGRGESQHVMVGQQREGPFVGLHRPGIVFSPDGSHHAYLAKQGKSFHLVIDGVSSSETFSWPLRALRFLPDGSVRFVDMSLLETTFYWVEARLHM